MLYILRRNFSIGVLIILIGGINPSRVE